jgi:hypothetical protein
MGFAGAEKPGDPDAICPFIIVVGIQKRFQALFHFVGQHIFFHFKAQAGLVIGFNDAFDGRSTGLLKMVSRVIAFAPLPFKFHSDRC